MKAGLALLLGAPSVALAGGVGWAAFAPVRFDSREEVFEIPKGTYARRMAGDPVEILPSEIHLVLGARDVLLLRNRDDVPQIFGPTLIMPDQSVRLPFDVASTYVFTCSAHASGQMLVIVDDGTTPWGRLRWRTTTLWRRLSPPAPEGAST